MNVETAFVEERRDHDLVCGIKRIAAEVGIPERKAYHLASRGLLPGVFQMGRTYWMSRAGHRAGISALIERKK